MGMKMNLTEKNRLQGGVCKAPLSKACSRANGFSRFKGFKPESEASVRGADVQKTTQTKAIMAAWFADKFEGDCNADYAYGCALDALSGIRATAAEINEFIEFLKTLPENDLNYKGGKYDFRERAGTFLSALINTSEEPVFDINLSGLVPLDDLAYENCKDLTITGNVGDNVGFANEGKLEIFGDSGDMLGFAHGGGELILWGHCQGEAGQCMDGGKLVIHGEFEALGDEMTGGEIHVSRINKFQVNETATGGKIYRNGKLVFDEGKWVGDD